MNVGFVELESISVPPPMQKCLHDEIFIFWVDLPSEFGGTGCLTGAIHFGLADLGGSDDLGNMTTDLVI